MAHAVIGGIITSTALTLVVVPVLFTYFDGFERVAQGAGGRRATLPRAGCARWRTRPRPCPGRI